MGLSPGLAVEAGVSAENLVVNIVKDRAKSGSMRCKRFRLGHITLSGGQMRRGVNGVISETMFFFYRGSWPSKQPAQNRIGLEGTTWDDTWGSVPPVELPQWAEVPYGLKSVIFEDIWGSRDKSSGAADSGAENEDDSEDLDPDNVSMTETPSKKKSKRRSTPSKKAGKSDSLKRQGGQSPSHPVLVSPPDVLLAALTDEKTQDGQSSMEQLFHNDYHSTVWLQAVNEWKATGAVIFTPGSGAVGVHAVLAEVPMLLLAINETHAEVLNYFIESGLAHYMQKAGNRLHDPALVDRLQQTGEDDEPKPKKSKKDVGSSPPTPTSAELHPSFPPGFPAIAPLEASDPLATCKVRPARGGLSRRCGGPWVGGGDALGASG